MLPLFFCRINYATFANRNEWKYSWIVIEWISKLSPRIVRSFNHAIARKKRKSTSLWDMKSQWQSLEYTLIFKYLWTPFACSASPFSWLTKLPRGSETLYCHSHLEICKITDWIYSFECTSERFQLLDVRRETGMPAGKRTKFEALFLVN